MIGASQRPHGYRAGAERAEERRARESAAQALRLKDAPPPVKTRQQKRAEERRAGKMPVGLRQADWHRLKGFPSVGRGGRRSA